MLSFLCLAILSLSLADRTHFSTSPAHTLLFALNNTDAAAGGWSNLGPSPADQLLDLTIAVRQQNTAELEKVLLEVSSPRSPNYGKHLSNEEVHTLVAPTDEDIQTIMAWLLSHGLRGFSLTPNSDFIGVKATVAQAEAILGAKYRMLQHTNSHQAVHRTSSYSLPADVAAAVDLVAPTVHIPPPPRSLKRTIIPSSSAAAGRANTPAHLRELYNVGDAVGKAEHNSMAVTAFLDQYYSESDLKDFWKHLCEGLTCGKGLPTLVGDATTGEGGIESMLDIESITGVAGNVHAEFWGYKGRAPGNKENEPFLTWLTAVSATPDATVPKLFSTSYGEDEDAWSQAAAERLNTEFMKGGARGITYLFASGDEGANCKGHRYVPEWPSSSPWITAVGGTTGYSEETAAGLSSGGFSGRWAVPDYQAAAVAGYLKSGKVPSQTKYKYNVSGRAYPDVSAQATDFTVYAGGYPQSGVAGTSCASPTLAGIIALLNDVRLQDGNSTLGFLNPWIYEHVNAWNDITSGSSTGCGFEDGWPARKGWDAATGAGSPNYGQLLTTLG